MTSGRRRWLPFIGSPTSFVITVLVCCLCGMVLFTIRLARDRGTPRAPQPAFPRAVAKGGYAIVAGNSTAVHSRCVLIGHNLRSRVPYTFMLSVDEHVFSTSLSPQEHAVVYNMLLRCTHEFRSSYTARLIHNEAFEQAAKEEVDEKKGGQDVSEDQGTLPDSGTNTTEGQGSPHDEGTPASNQVPDEGRTLDEGGVETGDGGNGQARDQEGS